MAYNTKPIVTDVDGNPISQYYNPDTDSYEPVEGQAGANKVVLYNADGTENNNLSLIPILEKLEQLTGTVIDEETRKSNELERIDNEDARQSNEDIRNTNEIERVNNEDIRIQNENTRIQNEDIRQTNEQDRVNLYNDLIDKVNSGYFNGKNLEFHWDGTKLGVRVEGDSEYIYVDLKGETGDIENLTMQHILNALGYTPIKSVNNMVADEAGNVELDIDTSEIENRIDDIEANIGDTSNLQTTSKDNLVNAINEVNAKGVDLTEIENRIGNVEDDLNAYKTDMEQTIDTINDKFNSVQLARVVGNSEEEINAIYDNYSQNFTMHTHYRAIVSHFFSHSVLGGGTFLLEGVKVSDLYEWQITRCYTTRLENAGIQMYVRSKVNGEWTPWCKIWHDNTTIGSYKEKLITLSGTSVDIDLSQGNVFRLSLSGNTQLTIPNTTQNVSHSFTLYLIQPSTAYSVTFPASVKWQNGTTPNLTANKTHCISFKTINGGTDWFGIYEGNF